MKNTLYISELAVRANKRGEPTYLVHCKTCKRINCIGCKKK